MYKYLIYWEQKHITHDFVWFLYKVVFFLPKQPKIFFLGIINIFLFHKNEEILVHIEISDGLWYYRIPTQFSSSWIFSFCFSFSFFLFFFSSSWMTVCAWKIYPFVEIQLSYFRFAVIRGREKKCFFLFKYPFTKGQTFKFILNQKPFHWVHSSLFYVLRGQVNLSQWRVRIFVNDAEGLSSWDTEKN